MRHLRGMRRVVLLASSLAALSSLGSGCDGDGLQATVGVIGQTCIASVRGDDPCGANLACGTDGRCTPASYVLVTPKVEPLSETSVRLNWTAATGHVAWYEVRVASSTAGKPAVVPAFAHVAPGSTSVVLTDLAPGTLGHVVVAAAIPAGPSTTAPSALLWTPFGAINEDSVNSVTPLTGYAGAPYAEGMFVSSHFSMFFGHAYVKESSFVFDGIPSSPIAQPIYNFASPLIKYANGFTYPDVTDVVQIWSDGVSRVLLSNNDQNRVLVYDHLPLTPDAASPDRLLGQTAWTGTSSDSGESSVNARGFSQAAGACFNGTALYVRDNGHNRILGWHGWPTQMGQAADFVLGQPDFASATANNGGLSKATLSLGLDSGHGVDCRGNHLVMADTGNHRVLIWRTAPTQSGAPADVVLGQSSGDQGMPGGAGGIAAGGLLDPEGVATLDGGGGRTAIVVADGNAKPRSSSGTTSRRPTARRSTASTANPIARRRPPTRGGFPGARSTVRCSSPQTMRTGSGWATSATAVPSASISTTPPRSDSSDSATACRPRSSRAASRLRTRAGPTSRRAS